MLEINIMMRESNGNHDFSNGELANPPKALSKGVPGIRRTKTKKRNNMMSSRLV